jgi:hypothetical protein
MMFLKVMFVLDQVVFCTQNAAYVHNLTTGKIKLYDEPIVICHEGSFPYSLNPIFPTSYITTWSKCFDRRPKWIIKNELCNEESK